jgi:flagellin-like protein
MRLKGISPLLATVILVALTVSIAFIIATVLSKTTTKGLSGAQESLSQIRIYGVSRTTGGTVTLTAATTDGVAPASSVTVKVKYKNQNGALQEKEGHPDNDLTTTPSDMKVSISLDEGEQMKEVEEVTVIAPGYAPITWPVRTVCS